MATPLFAFRLNTEIRGEVRKRADQLGISESEVVRRTLVQAMATQPLPQLQEAEAKGAEVPKREGVAA